MIGTQWLHSRVDVNGYEEYSSVEYRSAGCSEEYSVIGSQSWCWLWRIFKARLFAGAPNVQLHPTESYVSFTAIDGSKHEVSPESGEQVLEGDLRPNGEWKLVDKCVGLALVNRFNISQVYKCLIHWGTGTVNLELWSEERPVSKESPLRVSHEYEVTGIP
ncbi:UNVERIFIED_CONTAM: hypothetical protein Sradi_1731700 [Sesamum radiatum]|uniref:Uncharacterized protein n=1 Tax=Sesamum radiatum TaxID=300843 RepID=A0AAW2TUN6_SESRA